MGRKIILTEEEIYEIRKLYEQPELSSDNNIKSVSDTLNTALSNGIDLKAYASNQNYRVKWDDIGVNPEDLPDNIKNRYPEYVPELISGIGNIKNFDSSSYIKLLNIAKLIEDKSGLDIVVTAGMDKYHQEEKSKSSHNTGKALDFVVKGKNDDEEQSKIERAMLEIIMEKGINLSFINEFKRDTGGTGGHFHISLIPELNHYHFFDEALRSQGDESYHCCGKKTKLTFVGDGSYVKGIMNRARKKEKEYGINVSPDRFDGPQKMDRIQPSKITNNLPKQELAKGQTKIPTPQKKDDKFLKRMFKRN